MKTYDKYLSSTIKQGFFPVRERSVIASEFKNLCEQVMLSKAIVYFPGAAVGFFYPPLYYL